MKTDHLVAALAADTQIDRPPASWILPGLALALATAVLAIWGTLGFREDLMQSFATPLPAMRYVLTLALGVTGVRLALALSRPEGRGLAHLWPLAAVAALALGLLLWAFAATPQDGRQMAIVGKTMATCLISIPLLSILPVGVILFALHKGATTAPALAGFAAGIAGSGLAAMVYATHCTEDSPLFYVTWYGLAITGVTLVSTLIGTRLLRW